MYFLNSISCNWCSNEGVVITVIGQSSIRSAASTSLSQAINSVNQGNHFFEVGKAAAAPLNPLFSPPPLQWVTTQATHLVLSCEARQLYVLLNHFYLAVFWFECLCASSHDNVVFMTGWRRGGESRERRDSISQEHRHTHAHTHTHTHTGMRREESETKQRAQKESGRAWGCSLGGKMFALFINLPWPALWPDLHWPGPAIGLGLCHRRVTGWTSALF